MAATRTLFVTRLYEASLADAPEESRSFVTLTPAAGTVFIWESWLRHEVLANRAKTARISLSFNYAWR